MARLSDKELFPSPLRLEFTALHLRDRDSLSGMVQWEAPRSAAELNIACELCSQQTYASPTMLKLLQSPTLDDLSDPWAIVSYRRILSTFVDHDVRAVTIRRLIDLILRVAEPREQCMDILFDSVPHPGIGEEAAERFAKLARPDDVPGLLRRLDEAVPPKETTAPDLSNFVLPRIYCLVAAIGAAGDRAAATALLAFWNKHRAAWWRQKWRQKLRDKIAWALIDLARRERDLPLLDKAEILTREDYPTGALDFAIGAARVDCGDVARGIEMMIWRLDQSRSIEPTGPSAPEALVQAGINHFDVLSPYLDEPRLVGSMRLIVERVLERAADALSDAQLRAIAARAQLTGIQVWWDTSKDVYEVSREERVPVDFARCRDLAAAELARRSAVRR